MGQKQMAEAMEVDKSLISKWELGKNSPQAWRIERLAKTLTLDTSRILEEFYMI